VLESSASVVWRLMAIDLLLKDGLVILQGKPTKRSIAIVGHTIQGIYSDGEEPPAKEVMDCTGMYVLPGMIDMHVHLRDLNQSYKEDYDSGTRAAAAGGVTTVVDMPNSVPPVLSRSVLDMKINRARKQRFVNVGFYAGIPRDVTAFDTALIGDILGVKVYPHAPLADGMTWDSSRIHAALQLSSKYNLPLLFHPDLARGKAASVIEFFGKHSCKEEAKAVAMFVAALQEVGGHLHVCHVSCASAAELIMKSRAEEILTAEVTPHHLFLSRDDIHGQDGTSKVLPPLRLRQDREVLWYMLCKRCAIDCVASDHAPHTRDEKMRDFAEALSGLPGLETTVPLMITAVLEKRMTWADYLRTCCYLPARILGLRGKGILAKGFDADIVVVSPEEYEIQGDTFFSKARVTPFEGRYVKAKPVITIVEGQIVYDHGRFVVGPGLVGCVPVRKR